MFRSVKKEEITIPAQMSYLMQVREFIEHIGRRYKYSDKVVNSFKLVVDEACTNIIRHGYRDIKNGEIQLKAIIRRMSLTIVIVDHGVSYDPRQANTPDLANYVNIGKKGGLGILMMRKLMDDLQYAITERGNEFRLTKYRQVTDESMLLQRWHAFTMRTRYTLVASFILTILVVAIFGIFFLNLKKDVQQEVIKSTAASVRTMADNSIEDILNDKFIPLYEKVRSIKMHNKDIVLEAFIIDANNRVIARSTLLKATQLGRHFKLPQTAVLRDSVKGSQIFSYSLGDTTDIYDVSADIRESISGSGARLGAAHIWLDRATIEGMVASRRITLILVMLVILAIGYVGAFSLIRQILKSFHGLAQWVRQVIHGKVDEDEIDIDTSDEIGEIAQAFNEMTTKFRHAQVNLMEQQKLQKELQVAQEIQQMLLPSDFPEVEGFDIGSYYEAAKEVGGDLFDFVEVDDETVGIVVADVSGKGVPGSLIMTMIRTAIRLESRGNKNPADVLARVNHFVTDDMRRGMFVTMFYVILDSRNRVIHYASAGHNPMILFRSSSKQTYYLNPSGFPVGIQLPEVDLFDKKIQTDSIRLHEDDILVLYTDGITEAMNQNRDLYREERFLDSIRNNGHLDVSEFVKSIKDDLKHFTGGAAQNDDITFVAIKEKLMVGEIIYKTHKEVVNLIAAGMRVKDACDKLKISQYQYYKYKGIVDEGGLDALRDFLDNKDFIEKKHFSIEQKAKIFDIIRDDPKRGPKTIAALLNSEKYGSVNIDERRIYSELVKMRLNTFKLRKRFVDKGQSSKRLKQPGTPLLTLDGKVILDFESSEGQIAKSSGTPVPPRPVQSGSTDQGKKEPYVRIISHTDKKAVPPTEVKADDKLSERQARKTPPAVDQQPVIKSVPTEVATNKETVPTREDLIRKAVENKDPQLIESFYNACKEDFETLAQEQLALSGAKDTDSHLRKIKLILKIVSGHPILKQLPELQQLFVQALRVASVIIENKSRLKQKDIVKDISRVLNFLQKENILKTDVSITEKVNQVSLVSGTAHPGTQNISDKGVGFDAIRAKIAKKKLVKDISLVSDTKKK